MKRTLTIIGTILLVVAIATPAFARGRGEATPHGGMGGPEHPMFSGAQSRPVKGAFDKLTEEQRSQLDKLGQKFFDETAQLRAEIISKQAELKILLGTSNPDLEKAKALQKEISELGAKMAQEKLNFLFEARKISPDLPLGRGFGMGYGSHMKKLLL